MSKEGPAITPSKLCIALALPFLAVAPPARAQARIPPQAASAQPKAPGYDVMAIKPNKSGSGSVDTTSNNDSFSATNVSLKNLLRDVYNIKENLISGIPGPIDSARFDIEAKIVEPDLDAIRKLSNKQRRFMLLPLLEERFQLKAHTETRILPVYELVVIPSGAMFKQSTAGIERGSGTHINNSELTAHDVTMASFAETLTDQLHRTVVDKTGLTGAYDLALKWSLEDGSDTQAAAAPSLFTALQEQLGLKLQPARGPVETLVVDHVEMPSEN